jgi:hypothetical protein
VGETASQKKKFPLSETHGNRVGKESSRRRSTTSKVLANSVAREKLLSDYAFCAALSDKFGEKLRLKAIERAKAGRQ